MERNTSVKAVRVNVLEDSQNNPNSATLYNVNSSKKQKNIEVKCSYFENKGIKSPKNITCSVTIKVYSVKSPNKSIIYELYGNTLNPNYNQIVRLSAGNDIPLHKGDRSYGTFKEFLDIIEAEFDDTTKSFIDCAMKLINAQGQITKTPQFIMDIIEQERELDSEKVINTY